MWDGKGVEQGEREKKKVRFSAAHFADPLRKQVRRRGEPFNRPRLVDLFACGGMDLCKMFRYCRWTENARGTGCVRKGMGGLERTGGEGAGDKEKEGKREGDKD